MEEDIPPQAGMTISIRSRRDVVIVDPERFLAAARKARKDLYPEATDEAIAAADIGVYEAVHSLLNRDGQLAGDVLTASTIEVGRGGLRPGSRITDRPDGLSPAGWLQQIVLDDEMPLMDYGCFFPRDPFALPTESDAADADSEYPENED